MKLRWLNFKPTSEINFETISDVETMLIFFSFTNVTYIQLTFKVLTIYILIPFRRSNNGLQDAGRLFQQVRYSHIAICNKQF